MEISPAPSTKPRVALLIDGENIGASSAGRIIMKALPYGELTIRRVYGNSGRLGGWNTAPGVKLIHSGTGKNATDLLMTVEAMSFILGGQADVLVLATSDRDFVHLATHLRERSVQVIGIGESKTPEVFRKSCSEFVELRSAEAQIAAKVPKADSDLSELDSKIVTMVRDEGEDGAFLIGRLGGRMHAAHKIKIGELPEKTWRAYLLARPHLYECGPRGPDARVRLKT